LGAAAERYKDDRESREKVRPGGRTNRTSTESEVDEIDHAARFEGRARGVTFVGRVREVAEGESKRICDDEAYWACCRTEISYERQRIVFGKEAGSLLRAALRQAQGERNRAALSKRSG
jgi:hypothetical protein